MEPLVPQNLIFIALRVPAYGASREAFSLPKPNRRNFDTGSQITLYGRGCQSKNVIRIETDTGPFKPFADGMH